MKVATVIHMDEVYTNWKRLWFDDDDGVMKDDKPNISIMTEWEVVQERFMKADDNMKFHIKEILRKIVYLETTDLKPPSKPVKIKGSPKKVKSIESDNSTKYSRSYFEHVNSYFPNSPTLKSYIVILKGGRISKPSPSPPLPEIIHIN